MKVFAFLPPLTDYICPVLHGDSRLPWSNKSQSVLKIIQSKGALGELVRCQFNKAELFILFSRWREYWIAFAVRSLTHGGQCRIILLWLWFDSYVLRVKWMEDKAGENLPTVMLWSYIPWAIPCLKYHWCKDLQTRWFEFQA